MEKKTLFNKMYSNIYIRNLLLMFIIGVGIILFVLFALNIYTRHSESISVPNLKGLQLNEAVAIIKSANLEYEVVDSVFQKGGIPGAILDQIPKDSARVKEGRTIFLTVQARGEQLLSIPDLQDYSQRQAEALLNALGFNNITVEEIPSQFRGLVIAVEYKGKQVKLGQKIPKGAPLRMKVGSGSENNDAIDYYTPEVGETNEEVLE